MAMLANFALPKEKIESKFNALLDLQQKSSTSQLY